MHRHLLLQHLHAAAWALHTRYYHTTPLVLPMGWWAIPEGPWLYTRSSRHPGPPLARWGSL
eukprot:12913692-Prorocentrum_lima.AAC.1